MSAMTDEVPITELEKIEADRVDGVGTPANGIPFLLMKGITEPEPEPEPAVKGAKDCPSCGKDYDADSKQRKCENCGASLPAADDAAKSLPDWHADAVAVVKKAMVRGKVDETADIDGGQQAIALVGKLIGYEAQELAAGNLGEVADIELLGAAAGLLRQWVTGESAVQDGNVMPATALAQSAADDEAAKADLSGKQINDLPDSAFAHIESGGSKDADGKTTPRSLRHFPVHDAAHAKNALARLSSSPFGDKAKPKVMAAAKKFGIDTGTSKSVEVAEDATAVNTEPQGYEGVTKETLEAAVTKAMAPLQERIASLDAELAKVKATPIPGGPLLRATAQPSKAADGEDWAAKSAYYRQMADAIADPGTADGYRQLARQADDKANATS